MTADVLGAVCDLRRYPVKSMLGERIERAVLTGNGIVGDRRYALLDDETGKVISVKRPKRWGRMFELAGSTDGERVYVSFPDGASLTMTDPELPKRLSNLFGRAVSVATVPPADAAYDEAWAGELKEGAAPYLGMKTEVIDGEEFIDGGAFMRANQNFFDFGALHLVTTAATKKLAEHAPQSRFDPHRFRPNIVIDTPDVALTETKWQGRTLVIGDTQLTVGIPVPRCVMTTLAQADLPADRNVLRTISKHSAIDLLGTGTPYPCVGVYADVVKAGEIAIGDAVMIG
jgi:uncharacterized protein YcbX